MPILLRHVVLLHQVLQQQQLSLVFVLMTMLIVSPMTLALNQHTGQPTTVITDHFMALQKMVMLYMDHIILTESFGAATTLMCVMVSG
jgi:hypothetical protein